MRSTSAPKPNNPGAGTAAAADRTGVVDCQIPGQAVLVSECLWNRQAWCVGDEGCCLLSADDDENDPF